jgi:hypothetical protein
MKIAMAKLDRWVANKTPWNNFTEWIKIHNNMVLGSNDLPACSAAISLIHHLKTRPFFNEDKRKRLAEEQSNRNKKSRIETPPWSSPSNETTMVASSPTSGSIVIPPSRPPLPFHQSNELQYLHETHLCILLAKLDNCKGDFVKHPPGTVCFSCDMIGTDWEFHSNENNRDFTKLGNLRHIDRLSDHRRSKQVYTKIYTALNRKQSYNCFVCGFTGSNHKMPCPLLTTIAEGLTLLFHLMADSEEMNRTTETESSQLETFLGACTRYSHKFIDWLEANRKSRFLISPTEDAFVELVMERHPNLECSLANALVVEFLADLNEEED